MSTYHHDYFGHPLPNPRRGLILQPIVTFVTTTTTNK